MENLIKKSSDILYNSIEVIKSDFKNYLSNYDYSHNQSSLMIIDIKNVEDLNKVCTNAGFYIILLNKQYEENNCTFSIDDHVAIYRGHSYSVRDRIKSHLFNSEYNNSNFKYKTKYTVCLKFEDGIQGINLDKAPYCNYSWKVIVHKMIGSNKLIREQAELAFDEIYGRPFKSKER